MYMLVSEGVQGMSESEFVFHQFHFGSPKLNMKRCYLDIFHYQSSCIIKMAFKIKNYGSFLGEELKFFEDEENMVNVSVQGGHDFNLPKLFLAVNSKLFQDIFLDIYDIVTDIFIDVDEKTFQLYCDYITDGEVTCQTEEEFSCLKDFIKEMLPLETVLKGKEAESNSSFCDISAIPVKEYSKTTCRYCFKSFSNNHRCNGHEETCDKNPNKLEGFECHLCDKKCKTRDGVITHIERMHENKVSSHSCPECPKKYKHKGDLNRHMKKHENTSKKFICAMCDYETDRLDNLDRHEKIHADLPERKRNDDPIKKAMSKNSNLTFRCQDCNKKFRNSAQVIAHTKLKNCEELKCKTCKKDFSNKSNLKQHVKKFHE